MPKHAHFCPEMGISQERSRPRAAVGAKWAIGKLISIRTTKEKVMAIISSGRFQEVGWVWFVEVRMAMGIMQGSLSLSVSAS
jgi:hypothetical protein